VPVSYDPLVNQTLANTSISTAVEFLSRLTQKRCVVLTMVPTVGTQIGTAKAIASGFGLKLVTPGRMEGLQTYDGSHLDGTKCATLGSGFFSGCRTRDPVMPRQAKCREPRGWAPDSSGHIRTGASRWRWRSSPHPI
jgi:hypothetical protein